MRNSFLEEAPRKIKESHSREWISQHDLRAYTPPEPATVSGMANICIDASFDQDMTRILLLGHHVGEIVASRNKSSPAEDLASGGHSKADPKEGQSEGIGGEKGPFDPKFGDRDGHGDGIGPRMRDEEGLGGAGEGMIDGSKEKLSHVKQGQKSGKGQKRTH